MMNPIRSIVRRWQIRHSPSVMMLAAVAGMSDGFRAGCADAVAHPLSPPDATPEEAMAAFVAYYGPDGPGADFMATCRRMRRAALLLDTGDD